MTTESVAALSNTDALADLAELVQHPGPFATVLLPAPSGHDDAAHRMGVEWKNARRQLEDVLEPGELAELDDAVSDLHHGEAEAFAIVRAADGTTLVEPLLQGVERASAVLAPSARLAPILESRQSTLPHVLVVTDRAGADVVGFDGGEVAATEAVDGETLHIHRGHPGGWSQRRFQQRAENTWERNAGEVADVVAAMSERLDPVLIAIAGDGRASTLLVEALPEPVAELAVELTRGDSDGITEELLTLLADARARRQVAVLERLRAEDAQDRAVHADATLDALAEGRVELLLVHDDGGDEPTTGDDGSRVVDRAIELALATSAGIVVVPGVAAVAPVAGLLRW